MGFIRQKELEWRIANSLLSGRFNGTKIKRVHKKTPIDYTDPNNSDGPKVHLNHSFIKIADKILVMAGQGKYLGEGGSGKVKLAEDQKGNLYALKIGHQRGNVSALEQEIAQDVNIFQGRAISKRIDRSKEVVALTYLGVSLDKARASFTKEQKECASFLAVDETLKLHTGKLSEGEQKYIHGDINLPNLSLSSNCQRVYLLDYGMSIKASGEAFGSQLAHQDFTITDKNYHSMRARERQARGEYSEVGSDF